MILHHCILAGTQLDFKIEFFEEDVDRVIEYNTAQIGKVRAKVSFLASLINSRKYRNPVLAGICRNAFENETELPVLSLEFVEINLKNTSYPKSFKEKASHFLKHIYNKGGNDFKEFDFRNVRDYPIAYADDEKQFNLIMEHLEDKYFLKCRNVLGMSGHTKLYQGVQLTEEGIEEVEKELPVQPMIGLINQEITTGNTYIDRKINLAKVLFFNEPRSIEKMRSACESLSFVLEPLRNELESLFGEKDINTFFQIVNSFDVRHNKPHTSKLQFPEQLEWIFYGLLNTINTYTKLKERTK